MENHNDMLILTSQSVELYKKKIDYVNFSDIWNRKIPVPILRFMRNVPMTIEAALSDWKKNIYDYRTIVVFETDGTLELLKWIRTQVSDNTRLILYYRNSIATVHSGMDLANVQGLNYELWSYNLHDCENYGLKYNCQTLNRDLMLEAMDNTESVTQEKWDVVFLARAKGRQKQIASLESQLSEIGLKTFFYVVDFPELRNNKCQDNKSLPYKEYLKILANSRAVVDLVNDRNYGLTFRPLEAMFMKKKLITNYQSINRYDFYRKNNIMLLKDAYTDKIHSFLDAEYEEIPKEIEDQYDVLKWSKKFLEE